MLFPSVWAVAQFSSILRSNVACQTCGQSERPHWHNRRRCVCLCVCVCSDGRAFHRLCVYTRFISAVKKSLAFSCERVYLFVFRVQNRHVFCRFGFRRSFSMFFSFFVSLFCSSAVCFDSHDLNRWRVCAQCIRRSERIDKQLLFFQRRVHSECNSPCIA